MALRSLALLSVLATVDALFKQGAKSDAVEDKAACWCDLVLAYPYSHGMMFCSCDFGGGSASHDGDAAANVGAARARGGTRNANRRGPHAAAASTWSASAKMRHIARST